MVILTSSLTTGAASTMLLYDNPKSLRLIVVVAVAPVRSVCPGLVGGFGPSTSSVTSFVTPRIVRSPTSLNLPAPSAAARFDLNVTVGYFAASNNPASALRSRSRDALPVLTPLTSIVMSALMLSTDVPSNSIVPFTGPSVPRTVDTIRCLTLKPAELWFVSTVQVFGPTGGANGDCASTGPVRTAAYAAASASLRMGRMSPSSRNRYPGMTPSDPRAFHANAQVDHLDEHRERHREVDIALRDVLIEPFEQQRKPDEEQETQGEYLHRRVPVDETADGSRRDH